jgi:flagellar biosynthesis/type III secretory pathway chaperone
MEIKSKIEQLIGLLKGETDLYRSMQVVIDREKEATLQSDLNALNKTIIEKEKILVEIQQKEAQRRLLVADLSDKLGYGARDLTLTGISQLVEEPLAKSLNLVCQDFSSVLCRLQADNQRNQQIIEHSRDLIRDSFNLLNELLTPNTVYYRTGNIKSTKSTGKCVRSEV